ncbi:hypothetical protein [Xinfangfangia pollutisoli]|uniref:hypothetical protein n=1 Tax=Xinfangfangia pollutisoli TaxID=2865960 RepID=UPI001CD7442E|nr:hypothetical protein [Xinfangfangia pollutisoli]
MRHIAHAIALTGALASAVLPVTLVAALAGEGPVTPGPVFTPKLAVETGPVFVPPVPPPGSGTTGGDSATAARIVADINLARDYCGWLDQKEYVVDCLSDELNRVADAIPGGGEYAPAKAALKKAAQDLSSLVAANQSATLRPGIARVTNSDIVHTSTRPLRAVETAKLDTVSAAAIGIIQETGTILLRSAATSDESADFTAISAAVNSNTILLRSL